MGSMFTFKNRMTTAKYMYRNQIWLLQSNIIRKYMREKYLLSIKFVC